MQRQEIEQFIYQQTHQLPIEDLTEVLRFVEFVRFKNEHKMPNQETLNAIEAARNGEVQRYESLNVMWADLDDD